jgi:hypothetical protein
MRQALSLVLVLLIVTRLSPTAFAADDVKTQITAIPTGATIEVRLKNKQRMRGARGEVSSSGFTLLDPQAGDHQLAFDDITSVEQLTKKSHSTRNVWIGVGIGVVVAVAVVVVVVVIAAKTHNISY